MKLTPEIVLQHKCVLGEGPLWDTHRGTICWVDILKGDIHEYDVEKKVHRISTLQEMVGTIALSKNGDFIAALKSGIALVERNSGVVHKLVHPEKHLPGNRYNDGKCDPAGRLWVGSISLTEEPGAATLYMINPDLSFSEKIKNVTISNGLAWDGDQKTFYYIDAPTMHVVAYDFNVHTGEIANKRVVIEVPKSEGFPDGMTIDKDGMLWIGHWDGWQVARWDPRTGKKLLSIALPVARVSSCAFGGPSFEDLYITTASINLTPQQQADQPLAGSLFVVKNCGFKGLPAFEFDQPSFP